MFAEGEVKIVKDGVVEQGRISYENTKTFADLVRQAGEVHGDRVFLCYEKDDKIKEISYRKMAETCGAVAGWAEAQNEKQGHNIRVGILGGSSYPYVALLYGIMANGNVVVPLDVLLPVDDLCELIDRADVEVLIYDKIQY